MWTPIHRTIRWIYEEPTLSAERQVHPVSCKCWQLHKHTSLQSDVKITAFKISQIYYTIHTQTEYYETTIILDPFVGSNFSLLRVILEAREKENSVGNAVSHE